MFKVHILAVTSNVSEGPDRLLADVLVGGCDQANKGRNGPALHNSSSLIRSPRGNVGQSPGGLELDRRTVHQSQKGDKLGDETSTDHLVNGRMLVTGQQFPVVRTAQSEWSMVGSGL